MKNLTLKQLRYFEALASHSHFGRAARACSISQPALSMQIKELEEALGSKLLERQAREIFVTPFGAKVLERAKSIIRSVDELGDLARSTGKNFTGQLRIGIIPTIAPYLLPSLIGCLTHQHPGMDIHIRETQTEKLMHEIGEGRLDTAIVALPVSEAQFVETPLFHEEFLLVRPATDTDKPVPNSETLSKMRLLLLEEGHCFRDQALSFCNLQSSLPKEGLEGSSLSTLVQMVSAGIGVTLIPQMAKEIETRSANVSVSRFNKPRPMRTIGMIWRKTTPLSKQLSEIAVIVRDAASRERHGD